ncbi:AP-3 complex subunit beta-2 [Chytridiales sp. JEL 0842]|nr:AP-3 complex subunit beta-2 [Chytridiales sp. JEL 0842]
MSEALTAKSYWIKSSLHEQINNWHKIVEEPRADAASIQNLWNMTSDERQGKRAQIIEFLPTPEGATYMSCYVSDGECKIQASISDTVVQSFEATHKTRLSTLRDLVFPIEKYQYHLSKDTSGHLKLNVLMEIKEMGFWGVCGMVGNPYSVLQRVNIKGSLTALASMIDRIQRTASSTPRKSLTGMTQRTPVSSQRSSPANIILQKHMEQLTPNTLAAAPLEISRSSTPAPGGKSNISLIEPTRTKSNPPTPKVQHLAPVTEKTSAEEEPKKAKLKIMRLDRLPGWGAQQDFDLTDSLLYDAAPETESKTNPEESEDVKKDDVAISNDMEDVQDVVANEPKPTSPPKDENLDFEYIEQEDDYETQQTISSSQDGFVTQLNFDSQKVYELIEEKTNIASQNQMAEGLDVTQQKNTTGDSRNASQKQTKVLDIHLSDDIEDELDEDQPLKPLPRLNIPSSDAIMSMESLETNIASENIHLENSFNLLTQMPHDSQNSQLERSQIEKQTEHEISHETETAVPIPLSEHRYSEEPGETSAAIHDAVDELFAASEHQDEVAVEQSEHVSAVKEDREKSHEEEVTAEISKKRSTVESESATKRVRLDNNSPNAVGRLTTTAEENELQNVIKENMKGIVESKEALVSMATIVQESSVERPTLQPTNESTPEIARPVVDTPLNPSLSQSHATPLVLAPSKPLLPSEPEKSAPIPSKKKPSRRASGKRRSSLGMQRGKLSSIWGLEIVDSEAAVPLCENVYKVILDRLERFDKEKIDALKCLIAMISKGKNVSEYFAGKTASLKLEFILLPQMIPSDVVKNVASSSFEVRKLVYIYLLRYAEHKPDLALLSINTFQKDLNDRNPLIRAMALRVMSSIRVPVIVPLIMFALKKGVSDLSPYVRKAAANAIPKCYSLDPTQKEHLIEMIETLLNDNSTLVLGSVVSSINQVCPDRLDLIHKHYRKLCRMLIDTDEWAQTDIIYLLVRYARIHFLNPNVKKSDEPKAEISKKVEKKNASFYSDDEDDQTNGVSSTTKTVELDPDHDLLLRACVKLAAVMLYLNIAPLHLCDRPIKSLIQTLHTQPEEQHLTLLAFVTIAQKRASDYVRSADQSLVIRSVHLMGRISNSSPEMAEECLGILIALISSDEAEIVAESIIVTRRLLQLKPEGKTKLIISLSKSLDTITVPTARASIFGLVGQFHSAVPKIAPDVLRKGAKGFKDEASITKLQILNLGAKLCISLPPLEERVQSVVRSLFLYILELARFDSDYDIRDRGRFLKNLIFPTATPVIDIAEISSILSSAKPTPTLETPFSSHARFTIGSISHALGISVKGYTALPSWPVEKPDGSVREVPETQEWNVDRVVRSEVKVVSRVQTQQQKKKKVVDLDNFLDGSESESSEESEGESSEDESSEESEEDDDDEDQEEEEEEESSEEEQAAENEKENTKLL